MSKNQVEEIKTWSEFMGYEFGPLGPRNEDLKKLCVPHMRDALKHIMSHVLPSEKVQLMRKDHLLCALQSSGKKVKTKLRNVSQLKDYEEAEILRIELESLKREVNGRLEAVSQEAKELELLREKDKELNIRKERNRKKMLIVKEYCEVLKKHTVTLQEKNKDINLLSKSPKSSCSVKDEVEGLVTETQEVLEVLRQDEGGEEEYKKLRDRLDILAFASPTSAIAQQLALCLSKISTSLQGLVRSVNEKPKSGEKHNFIIELEKQHVIRGADVIRRKSILSKNKASQNELFNLVLLGLTKHLKEDSRLEMYESEEPVEETVHTWLTKKISEVECEATRETYISLSEKLEKDINKNETESRCETLKNLEDLRQQIVNRMEDVREVSGVSGVKEAIIKARMSYDSYSLEELDKAVEAADGSVEAEIKELMKSCESNHSLSKMELSCLPQSTSQHAIIVWLLKKLEENRIWNSFLKSEIQHQDYTRISATKILERETKNRIEVESCLNDLDEKLDRRVSMIENCSDDVAFCIKQPMNKYIPPGLFEFEGNDFHEWKQRAVDAVNTLRTAIEINRKVNQERLQPLL